MENSLFLRINSFLCGLGWRNARFARENFTEDLFYNGHKCGHFEKRTNLRTDRSYCKIYNIDSGLFDSAAPPNQRSARAQKRLGFGIVPKIEWVYWTSVIESSPWCTTRVILQWVVEEVKMFGLGHSSHFAKESLNTTYFRDVFAGRNSVLDDLLAFLYVKPTLLENFPIS